MKENRIKASNQNDFETTSGQTLFIAITFAAIFTFVILGYLKLSLMKHPDQNIIVESEISTLSTQQQEIRNEIDSQLPAQASGRQPPSRAALAGVWGTKIGAQGHARLNFDGENFEMIYMDAPDSAERKFSKGLFKYNEQTGRITLYPSREAGEPAPIPGVRYSILTMRHYDMLIYNDPETQDLFFVAPADQIAAKNYYPLFSYANFSGAPILKFSSLSSGQAQ